MTKPDFRLEASFDQGSGRVMAVYLRVRDGKLAKTKEIKSGVVNADYDADGNLLGVEVLGPCEVEVLERAGRGETEAVKAFLRNGAPRGLIAAA